VRLIETDGLGFTEFKEKEILSDLTSKSTSALI